MESKKWFGSQKADKSAKPLVLMKMLYLASTATLSPMAPLQATELAIEEIAYFTWVDGWCLVVAVCCGDLLVTIVQCMMLTWPVAMYSGSIAFHSAI